jgi:plasmid stabilization system protein ParE
MRQLADIVATIEIDNPGAADNFGRQIDKLAGLLARNPKIGRITRKSDFRVFPVDPFPYLVFYRVLSDREGIMIYRVRHMARKQDWRRGR